MFDDKKYSIHITLLYLFTTKSIHNKQMSNRFQNMKRMTNVFEMGQDLFDELASQLIHP